MDGTWLDDEGRLLTSRCPLPLDVPFTLAMADALGVSRTTVATLARHGLVRPVLRGVYAATQAPHDTALRAAALSLVIPPTAVVADRTAAWLHGVDILPRSAVVVVPPLDVVHTDDTRVRRPETNGRRRQLRATDITNVGGIRVTTPLRTALDLGRLLWRFDALAAIDGFLRVGVDHDRLLQEVARFRGFRGVRQLRNLAPLGDGRSESAGESALRLCWHDAGLPTPQLQWWVPDERGIPVFRLDLADPAIRYAAEYDGEAFHGTEEARMHDSGRRDWLAEHGWHVDVFTKQGVYDGDGRFDPVPRLLGGYRRARRAYSRWTPYRRSA